MALVEELIGQGWLKSPRIIEAFRKIKREDFLPQDLKYLADLNEALPINQGQTISQPLVVAFMLELLQPRIGERVLDIGSGSGWTATLLADIISQKSGNSKSETLNPKQKGKVIALEIIPELKKFGQSNVAKYSFIKKGIVELVCDDGSRGWPKEAPYDRILVSASLQENNIPKAWQEQLKINGWLVCPIKNSIWLFKKKTKNEFEKFEYPGFVFVPLVKNH